MQEHGLAGTAYPAGAWPHEWKQQGQQTQESEIVMSKLPRPDTNLSKPKPGRETIKLGKKVEAGAGVEPTYMDLQSSA